MLMLALFGPLAIASGIAFADHGPPTPVVTSHPATPTASTSASFAFTDPEHDISFSCSLDDGAFAACTSPKSYTGLGAGAHTFRVRAQSTSDTSDPASYTWTIDLTPPSIVISAPASGGAYNLAGWTAECGPGGGVCGSVTDPSAITSVAVSIRQNTSGKYWTGTGYTSSTETYEPASLSHSASTGASWFYPLSLPEPDGQYTLHVRATDGLGNATPSTTPAASPFTTDTVPPPAPSITTEPAGLTDETAATFGVTDTATPVGYLCRLDGGPYSSCAAPKSYGNLVPGTHTFSVEAQDAAGNVSPAVSYGWVIDISQPPHPTINEHPSNPSTSTSATFTFTETRGGSTFQCKLDSPTWTSCSTPVTYTGLTIGHHEFDVRAVDPAGNLSFRTEFHWRISQTTGAAFTITGNAAGRLYPGAPPRSIAVEIGNPNTAPIYITGLTATLLTANLPAGCPATGFQVGQSNISSTLTVLVPANGSVTLPAQGATAPSVQMLDTKTNQNACAGATLTLSYTGSAHS